MPGCLSTPPSSQSQGLDPWWSHLVVFAQWAMNPGTPTAGTQAPGATQEPEAAGQTVGTHIRQAQFSTHKRCLVG